MRSNSTKKVFHNKGNHKQDEKATLRMSKNNFNQSSWQRIHVQNLQAAQYQKNKQPNQKNRQKT